MRVTAGTFRRRSLRSAASDALRPTARRLRERLFELLAARTEGARFLDLCAGSGAVGIEALSRGAGHVTFVDCAADACALVAANLAACGAGAAQSEIMHSEAADFLRRAGRTWDVAYFDPPYAADYAPVLALFAAGAALRPRGGTLVVEHHCEHALPARLDTLRRWRLIRHGQSCLSFYERRR
ncbi:MAG TPA: 16S rRNA (guanine(966)-N(2))-methyltransferase RsmD [Pyrinomonadaceae bacterium]|jgi:16S rRNA (guanine(966)-N(2))-methyltransferase RsmD